MCNKIQKRKNIEKLYIKEVFRELPRVDNKGKRDKIALNIIKFVSEGFMVHLKTHF